MSDLVKRLRSDAAGGYGNRGNLTEAAARIEELEAVLEYIRDGKKLNHVHMRRAAAVALKGGDT